ncbi:hypothetical protein [Acrocarpospora sp. B8E8]|uniref:hypothetical protein n=1 Tax=Acrocarpospora sp. B8E8 TaxID=3153572 RepID=UPI00325F1CE5
MTVTLEKSVEDFIATPRQLFIGGRWVHAASGKTFATLGHEVLEAYTEVKAICTQLHS